ncbi:unnamed protein product [Calypogeia fissa]
MDNFKRRVAKLWRGGRTSGNVSDGGSSETRIVHINDRTLNELYRYPKNRTATTKYTWYSFLPLSLFVQYRRAAYWYFTAMAILSITPFSPYSYVSVVLPLVFVLVLGLGREFWEDVRRARGDREVNSRPVQVMLDGGRVETLQWKDIQVGDLVRVTDGEYFPADLLLLCSSGPDGVCYVETKNLDGETNLKVRQALESTWNLDEESLKTFKADVTCEVPNPSLYTFTGQIELRDGSSLPLGPAQLLLRDSSLQNTGHIWGAAIYTGHDSKVMQNATIPPSKRSRIDKSLDTVIYAMFGLLLIMSIATGAALGYQTHHDGPDIWYLVPYVSNPYYDPNKAVVAGIVSAVSGLILYGYLIPIALYVSLEIVRVIQGIYMMQDLGMYDTTTDTPARVKSTGLNEELGQVDTILSDKTGTLTCNQMDFFRCTIAGLAYGKGTTEVERAARRLGLSLGNGNSVQSGDDGEDTGPNPYEVKGFNFSDSRLLGGNWVHEPNADMTKLFFQILALCHTAIPEGNPDDPQSMEYRAESPDEAALVVAAKQFGFCFYKRTPSTMLVRESLGPGAGYKDQTHELLNVLEFNSARKRMSVIVRYPDRRIMLLSKGADSVMAQRVDPAHRRFLRETLIQLRQFAEVGLRTLVVAYRELDEADYQKWQAEYVKVRSVIGREREQRIEEVAHKIERNLWIVGGTGVEDKLQDGVPDTIDRLAQAGINIWVLTGDKVETAINIGYACSLLRKGMQKIIISLEGAEAREVEERAEKENLSSDEVNKELKNIVAQQLLDGNVEIGRIRNEEGAVFGDYPEDNGVFGLNSQSFSGNLLSMLSRRPSHREAEQELQEFTSMTRQENGEAAFLKDTKEQQNQLDGFGSKNMTSKKKRPSAPRNEEPSFAFVIDGYSLAFVLDDDSLQEEFIRVCKQCTSILCCRVSPRQKAQVTKLVRKGMGENRLCLGIGDGANDVGMIQAANVGVGIAGVEGAQAAMAGDYAIGQFRFLERLLLVHGHWSYRRISLMILYFFYKVSLIGWIAFCCNAFTFFSGQPLYNDWYASFYNTLFTAIPICVIGVIDQDVSAADLVKYPQLYRAGQKKEFFNRTLVFAWLLNSVYTGLIIFFFPAALYWVASFRSGGQTASLQEFGALLFTCLVIVPNVQLTIVISYFTWIHHITIWGSIALWYVFLIVFGALPVTYSTTAYKELIEAVGASPSFWLLPLVVVVACLLPEFVFRCYKKIRHPSDYHIVLEISSKVRRQQSISRSG